MQWWLTSEHDLQRQLNVYNLLGSVVNVAIYPIILESCITAACHPPLNAEEEPHVFAK